MRMNGTKRSVAGAAFGRRELLLGLVVAGSFTLACWRTRSGPVITPEAVGAVAMVPSDGFEPALREAVRAASSELIRQGDSPADFYAEVRKTPEGEIVLQLWHSDAFRPENRDTVGNPGGKCRTMYFDPGTHRIVRELRWQ
jgi:hypothetical protein